jgi:hypothetical protein
VNAQEQAQSLELTSKIATVVNLFKLEFPDAKADFKPWRNDPDTREWIDPDSIDLGFHFPGWSRQLQCNSILVQIRFSSLDKNLIGLEIAGFNHQGMAWQLSTVDQWQFVGSNLPNEDRQNKLKNFCRQVFTLFKSNV